MTAAGIHRLHHYGSTNKIGNFHNDISQSGSERRQVEVQRYDEEYNFRGKKKNKKKKRPRLSQKIGVDDYESW